MTALPMGSAVILQVLALRLLPQVEVQIMQMLRGELEELWRPALVTLQGLPVVMVELEIVMPTEVVAGVEALAQQERLIMEMEMEVPQQAELEAMEQMEMVEKVEITVHPAVLTLHNQEHFR